MKTDDIPAGNVQGQRLLMQVDVRHQGIVDVVEPYAPGRLYPTEMAIHIGYVRAGWLGLLAGGLGFILPATFIVLALAWLYVQYGTTPQAEWLLYGIKPVVVAVIAQALWNLASKAELFAAPLRNGFTL